MIIKVAVIDAKKKQRFVSVSKTKSKKSIKVKNLILVKKWVKFQSEESLLTTFVDFETKINFNNQAYAVQ